MFSSLRGWTFFSIFFFSTSFVFAYNWDDNPGNGSAQSPYQISTLEQLLEIGLDYDVENDYFILMNDIVLDPVNNPDHVFSQSLIPDFSGVFDGQGHSIYNLYIENTSSEDSYGLFGTITERTATFVNIKNLILIHPTIKANNGYTGGLVGRLIKGGIKNCGVVSGNVSGGYMVGGLVGFGDGKVDGCFSTADVSDGFDVGGLVGNGCIIINSYATGNVSDGRFVGGLFGADAISVTNCYSTGSVFGYFTVGGLCGYVEQPASVVHSYWDTMESGIETSPGGVGLTTEQMSQRSSFESWDFDSVWDIDEGRGYPYLRWYALTFNSPDIVEPVGVGMEDFAVFSEQWGQDDCWNHEDCAGADFNRTGQVDLADLMLLVSQWLDARPGPAPPMIHWAMDGNTNDSSGNNINGVIYFGYQWIQDGAIGSAISLDNGSAYMFTPNYYGIAGGEGRTCAMWIRTTKNQTACLLSWGRSLYSNYWMMALNSDGLLQVSANGGIKTGTTYLADGSWHHIAVVLDDDGSPSVGEIRLLVDGQLEDTTVSGGDIVVNTVLGPNLCLGGWLGNLCFEGQIDDVQIYDFAISDYRVSQLAAE